MKIWKKADLSSYLLLIDKFIVYSSVAGKGLKMIIGLTRRPLLLYSTTPASIDIDRKPSTDQDGGSLTCCRNWPYIDEWNPLNGQTKRQNNISTSIVATGILI